MNLRSLKLASVALLLYFAMSCDLIFNIPHPSDDTLLRNFQEHEADFALLARMASEDSRVVRIAYDFTWLEDNAGWPRPESELGFSRQRWDEYRRLFRKLDLEAGLLNHQPDIILFLASTKGLMTGGSMKGYAYLVTRNYC